MEIRDDRMEIRDYCDQVVYREGNNLTFLLDIFQFPRFFFSQKTVHIFKVFYYEVIPIKKINNFYLHCQRVEFQNQIFKLTQNFFLLFIITFELSFKNFMFESRKI